MFISKKKVEQIEDDLDVLCQRIDYIENWAYLLFEHLGVAAEAEEELAEDGTVKNFRNWKLVKK